MNIRGAHVVDGPSRRHCPLFRYHRHYFRPCIVLVLRRAWPFTHPPFICGLPVTIGSSARWALIIACFLSRSPTYDRRASPRMLM